MFITEMVVSGKEYYRQKDLLRCLELCKALAVESLYTQQNSTAGTQSAWWTLQGVSICFKATFNNPREMFSYCQTLVDVAPIEHYDKYKRPIKDTKTPQIYEEILKILKNNPCTE